MESRLYHLDGGRQISAPRALKEIDSEEEERRLWYVALTQRTGRTLSDLSADDDRLFAPNRSAKTFALHPGRSARDVRSLESRRRHAAIRRTRQSAERRCRIFELNGTKADRLYDRYELKYKTFFQFISIKSKNRIL